MVFYLKYRPQKLKELDSLEVQNKLGKVLKNPPHAFLFTGPKGLGKTSAARIVAKILNCQAKNRDGLEPCNKCAACVSITAGTNMDVIEIDAASNRGIDEIRDLREKVRLTPVSSKKKVYIIDEVHMLTTEAFNALLKTLEEPPTHVVFILCTTELHKLPETVVSRCFHVVFSKATSEEMERSISRIAKREKLEIDKEAMSQVAQVSDGSFRDGAKILEELSKEARAGKITKEMVDKRFKTSTVGAEVENLVNDLLVKNTKSAFAILAKLEKEGIDMKFFMEVLLEKLHQILLQKVENSDSVKLSIADLIKLIDSISLAYSKMKYSILPQLPLEIAIVEWSDDVPEVQVQENVEKEEVLSTQSVSKNDKILKDLINTVKTDNFSVAGILRGCVIDSFDGKNMVISASYKFHKEKLEDQKVREIIEKNMATLTGGKVKVSFNLKSSGGDA